ncbi:MAG TPA: hypothetical protein ENN07_07620 [candidate division Zixibacteria bacterium]|nr:hypothetical protein [candidate division Zixibacteria bacterium]
MKNMRLIWLLNAIVIALFILASPAFTQVAVSDAMEARTETPDRPDRSDIVPLEASDDAPVMAPVEIMPERSMHDGGPPPTDPGEAMSVDSRDIYIYVTLLAPLGPDPPDTVEIIAKGCASGSERVEFKVDLAPTGYFGNFYNVYRDTVPMFFMSQVDTTTEHGNIIGRTQTRFFTDNFLDTLYLGYLGGSKGVCDTLVNLFYVFTTVDTTESAPDGYLESPRPSYCLAEYDQAVYAHPTYGTTNFWSIPNFDERFEVCSDLHDLGIRQVMEWDPVNQVPVLKGLYNVAFARWLTDGPLQVGHIYQVSGNYDAVMARPSEHEYFQTYKPGIIPTTDSVFTMVYSPTFGGRNIIMLPFKASIVEGITNRATLVTSIQESGALHGIEVYRIDAWDGSAFIWNTIALKITPTIWNANPSIRPGKPIRVWLRTDSGAVSFTWPIT